MTTELMLGTQPAKLGVSNVIPGGTYIIDDQSITGEQLLENYNEVISTISDNGIS